MGFPANPPSVSGDPELPGFVLDLRLVWEPWGVGSAVFTSL
jgi:hypothetical protein